MHHDNLGTLRYSCIDTLLEFTSDKFLMTFTNKNSVLIATNENVISFLDFENRLFIHLLNIAMNKSIKERRQNKQPTTAWCIRMF